MMINTNDDRYLYRSDSTEHTDANSTKNAPIERNVGIYFCVLDFCMAPRAYDQRRQSPATDADSTTLQQAEATKPNQFKFFMCSIRRLCGVVGAAVAFSVPLFCLELLLYSARRLYNMRFSGACFGFGLSLSSSTSFLHLVSVRNYILCKVIIVHRS